MEQILVAGCCGLLVAKVKRRTISAGSADRIAPTPKVVMRVSS
nr:hypothetical protein [Bordetella bronchiseptica]